MLFTSYRFLAFLAIVIVLYYMIPKKMQWPFLLIASYVFYYMANPFYLIYIGITTVTTYLAGRWIQQKKQKFKISYRIEKTNLDKEQRKQKKQDEKKKEKNVLVGCLFINIGILAVVKYTNFTISNINAFMSNFGNSQGLTFVNWILPLGISFYTFQAMGYLIDVYRGKYEAEKNLFRFALFVSFFPQLIQGPISRYNDLAKSLFEEHKADYQTISFGLQRILWGFFKKLVIADRILVAVNTIVQNPQSYSGAFVFMGMLFYALELYADFTGGIDITIGIAQTLGITVTENFNRPYFSKSLKEFWKRWHITMGTWFTDYIFYPVSVSKPMIQISRFSRKHLGETIGKRIPMYLSSFIVWFATGIWHGASWNFVVWGLGNFVVLMLSKELEPFYRWFHKRFSVQEWFGYRMFQTIRTFLLVSSLRLFDCYRDVPLTFRMFGKMFADFRFSQFQMESFVGLGLQISDYLLLIVCTILLLMVSMIQRKGSVRGQIANLALPIRFVLWYGLFLIVLICGTYGIGYQATQFIYNQF